MNHRTPTEAAGEIPTMAAILYDRKARAKWGALLKRELVETRRFFKRLEEQWAPDAAETPAPKSGIQEEPAAYAGSATGVRVEGRREEERGAP